MHNDIHVVLDSVACSDETELRDNPRCHVMRLIVNHGKEEWVDGDRTLKEMFDMVERNGELPGTSQPPIGWFLEMFTNLSNQGKKVIMICVDSVLSGTYQTACLAAKQVMKEVKGADIRVVDSHTAACSISGCAIEILRKTAEGMSLDEAEKYANDLMERTETYFTVNTLDYLKKGGRIGAVGALVGNILGIRPIVHLDNLGRLEIADKIRTRKKTLKRMLDMASENAPIEAIFIAHGEADEDAEMLKQEMHSRFPEVPIMVTGIGTVLAAHLGPGAIGIFVRRKA